MEKMDVSIGKINKCTEEYLALLEKVHRGDKTVNESTMQDFLERHAALIPTPFLLNHGLHFDAFISKLPIGSRFCDLAYLTKSSDEWWVVLLELENPHKKLFKGDVDHAEFTADFTQALQQIKDWKTYISDYKNNVINTIQRLLQPLSENKVSFKYVLVMGSREETLVSKARRRALAEENRGGIKILTYETILSDYMRESKLVPPADRLILTLHDSNRFKIKYIPIVNSEQDDNISFNTMIFSYLTPEDIKLTDKQIAILNAGGYDMDNWLKGKPLSVNNKYIDSDEVILSIMKKIANGK